MQRVHYNRKQKQYPPLKKKQMRWCLLWNKWKRGNYKLNTTHVSGKVPAETFIERPCISPHNAISYVSYRYLGMHASMMFFFFLPIITLSLSIPFSQANMHIVDSFENHSSSQSRLLKNVLTLDKEQLWLPILCFAETVVFKKLSCSLVSSGLAFCKGVYGKYKGTKWQQIDTEYVN